MTDDQLIEKVARALCRADGHDPDEIIEVPKSRGNLLILVTAKEPRWLSYKYVATQHVASFRIITQEILRV